MLNVPGLRFPLGSDFCVLITVVRGTPQGQTPHPPPGLARVCCGAWPQALARLDASYPSVQSRSTGPPGNLPTDQYWRASAAGASSSRHDGCRGLALNAVLQAVGSPEDQGCSHERYHSQPVAERGIPPVAEGDQQDTEDEVPGTEDDAYAHPGAGLAVFP